MTQSVPSQRKILYNGMWNEDMDEDFLSNIVDEVRYQVFRCEIPTHALLCAQSVLQRKYNVVLSFDNVFERFMFLKKRYETFTWLVRDKGTSYDISNNIVLAPEHVWERLFQQDELTKAYYTTGEPQHIKLELLFGFNKVIKKEEASKIIVNISDTVSPPPNPPREYVLISDTLSPNPIRYRTCQNISEDDEVTSPISAANIISRRRLFDAESRTNAMPGTSFPPLNVAPRAPKFDRGESSCASSSPSKWYKP